MTKLIVTFCNFASTCKNANDQWGGVLISTIMLTYGRPSLFSRIESWTIRRTQHRRQQISAEMHVMRILQKTAFRTQQVMKKLWQNYKPNVISGRCCNTATPLLNASVPHTANTNLIVALMSKMNAFLRTQLVLNFWEDYKYHVVSYCMWMI